MTKAWLEKNRRVVLGIAIFAILIGANLVVHLRRRAGAPPPAPPAAAVTADPLAMFPTVSPGPKPVAGAIGSQVTPIPGGAMSEQFAGVARTLADMETAFGGLDDVITIPSASEPFIPPTRNIFRWQALPVASAPVAAPASLTAATEPVPLAQPVILGQFTSKGREFLLMGVGDRAILLPEGQLFAGESYSFLGTASGEAVLRDGQGYSLTLAPADSIEPSVREAMDALTGPPRPLIITTIATTASGTSPPP